MKNRPDSIYKFNTILLNEAERNKQWKTSNKWVESRVRIIWEMQRERERTKNWIWWQIFAKFHMVYSFGGKKIVEVQIIKSENEWKFQFIFRFVCHWFFFFSGFSKWIKTNKCLMNSEITMTSTDIETQNDIPWKMHSIARKCQLVSFLFACGTSTLLFVQNQNKSNEIFDFSLFQNLTKIIYFHATICVLNFPKTCYTFQLIESFVMCHPNQMSI